MSVCDRIRSCGRRQWQTYDILLCCYMTAVATAAIALVVTGLLARRGLIPHVSWKALVGTGAAMPFFGMMLFGGAQECKKVKLKPKERASIAFQIPEASTEAKRPHNLYKEHGLFASIGRADGKRIYLPILPSKKEDPFFDRLKPGDQLICHMVNKTYIIFKYDTDDADDSGYTYSLLADQQIDDFNTIIDGTLITSLKQLEKVLKPGYNAQNETD